MYMEWEWSSLFLLLIPNAECQYKPTSNGTAVLNWNSDTLGKVWTRWGGEGMSERGWHTFRQMALMVQEIQNTLQPAMHWSSNLFYLRCSVCRVWAGNTIHLVYQWTEFTAALWQSNNWLQCHEASSSNHCIHYSSRVDLQSLNWQ